MIILTHQEQTALESIVGKVEIACNKQFLLFPQCFLLNQIIVSAVVHSFEIISSFAAKLEKPKIGISGKGLKKGNCKISHFISHGHTLPNGDLMQH